MRSLSVLLDDLRARGVRFRLVGDSLKFSDPKAALTAALRAEMKQRKPEIMAYLQGLQPSTMTAMSVVDRSQKLPLSFSQQRLWLMHQLADHQQVYNIPCVWHLQGALNIDVLERSLQQLVARHESLRTAFVEHKEGELIQLIQDNANVHLPLIDLSRLTKQEQKIQLQAQQQNVLDTVFNLEKAPLLQAALLRLQADDYRLIVVMHHIIADGWSLQVFVRELAAIYTSLLTNSSAELAELVIQYADFAYWQRQEIQQGHYASQLAYWQQQLADAPALLRLPSDRPRPAQQCFKGAVHAAGLPNKLLESLRGLAKQTETTLFMVLQAAFAALLARYTAQDDILIGSPIANRQHVETEALIGCFINTLVLRNPVPQQLPFRKLLAHVRQTTLDAYDHQDLPFDVLVEALQPERSNSYAPLFQVMFVLQNTQSDHLQLPAVKAKACELDSNVSAFDLTLSMQESEAGLVGFWEYATALFDQGTIERMAEHFHVLLAGIVANPWQSIAQLPLLNADERHQVLYEWNNTATDYPRHIGLTQLFDAQVKRSPNAIAACFAEQSLTYRELNARANRLAYLLINEGVQPDKLVGICVERSLEMLVAMLGVLKAEGAYLPLDPNYPEERLRYMIADARLTLLLTQSALTQLTRGLVSSCLYLDSLDWGVEVLDAANVSPVTTAQAEHLAYVIYTSGSTGQPKGVMISQRALLSRSLGLIKCYHLAAADRVLQFATFSFDVAAEEIFPALLSGACVVIAPPSCRHSVPELMKLVQREQLSVLNLPAPYWHEWVAQLKTVAVPDCVRLVITGSDKVLKSRMRIWKQQVGERVPVYCGYGPTEATITATLHTEQDTERGSSDGMFIGRPLPDTKIYILDQHGQTVPIGVPGELYIAGEGLARGYLHKPEQTVARFIPNPYRDAEAAYLYRSGDSARYLADGTLELLGRLDDQVKIRGFRIELDEISAALSQHESVSEAIVLAKEKQPEDYYLAAYIVPKTSAEIIAHPASTASHWDEWQLHLRHDLRAFCIAKLPDYMVPTVFVLLDELPLTPSGKVNKRALPVPEVQSTQVYKPPRTATEQALALIWQTILEVQEVGATDNFFALGGHSLLVTRLLHHVADQFDIDLPMASLFSNPILEDFAHCIEQACQGLSHAVKAVDFQAEVWLDATLKPPTNEFQVETDNLRAIFVTGATGFVGAFLLHELLQQTTARLHCLVRAKDVSAGMQRIKQSLCSYGLWCEAYLERLQVHTGDLAKPNLGLSVAEFAKLAQIIDVIYHNGAWVNHVYPYSILKAANVEGTRETLRLACEIRRKPVHFISSLSVFGPEITEMYEEAELDQPELLENGYVESKWVADKLVSLAGKRGLPVTIHRLSGVCGILQNRFVHVNDNYFRSVLTAVQLGIALDSPLGEDNIVPVDYAVEAIVYLSTQRSQLGKVFHIGNPRNTANECMIKALFKAGYRVRLLPPQQWQAELFHQAKDCPDIGLHPLLPLLANYDFTREPEHIVFDGRNTLAGLSGTGIECPAINTEQLASYFTWLAEQGYLPSTVGEYWQEPTQMGG